jgi:hypothetical protein
MLEEKAFLINPYLRSAHDPNPLLILFLTAVSAADPHDFW